MDHFLESFKSFGLVEVVEISIKNLDVCKQCDLIKNVLKGTHSKFNVENQSFNNGVSPVVDKMFLLDTLKKFYFSRVV